MKIELEVQPLYESRFVTSVEQVVPCSFLPQVQQDTMLPVFFLEETRNLHWLAVTGNGYLHAIKNFRIKNPFPDQIAAISPVICTIHTIYTTV